jgi:hypothetical protein
MEGRYDSPQCLILKRFGIVVAHFRIRKNCKITLACLSALFWQLQHNSATLVKTEISNNLTNHLTNHFNFQSLFCINQINFSETVVTLKTCW